MKKRIKHICFAIAGVGLFSAVFTLNYGAYTLLKKTGLR